MTSTPADLLRLLGAQAIPGVAPVPGASQKPAPGIDFARLLDKARSGQLASGRDVTIARGSGIELSEDQMKRLAAAADMAESQGATRAVVVMDGMTFKLDVAMREITAQTDLAGGQVLTGIDAVIHVPPEAGKQPASPARLTAAPDNASILGILSRRDKPRAA